MSNVDVLRFTSDELTVEKLDELVKAKKSFWVVAVKDMSYTVNKIEGSIEKQGMSCRVYTEDRSSLMAGFVPSPLFVATSVVAAATAVGTAVHNLATYDPDYEIGKNPIKSKITVTFKKE